jgi:hypothetical protein
MSVTSIVNRKDPGTEQEERGINEDRLGKMVLNSSLLLDGRRYRRRTFRIHCTYTYMECVTAIVLFNHTTWYWSTPSKFLDSGACGDNYFHYFVASLDMEAN